MGPSKRAPRSLRTLVIISRGYILMSSYPVVGCGGESHLSLFFVFAEIGCARAQWLPHMETAEHQRSESGVFFWSGVSDVVVCVESNHGARPIDLGSVPARHIYAPTTLVRQRGGGVGVWRRCAVTQENSLRLITAAVI